MSSVTAISVKISLAEKKRLAAVAKQSNRSAHFVMREAMLSFLDTQEQRIALIREADTAWKDYKETGESYSLDEVETWFDSDRSKPAPWQR
jgi:predicted transcriptional regulator